MAAQTAYKVRPITFEALSGLWPGSQTSLDWRCLFTLPPWLHTWWSVFKTDQEALILAVENSDGVVALAPLMRRDTSAELIGSPNVCDYLDVVAGQARDNGCLAALLQSLRHSGIRQLTLHGVHPDALVWTDLVPAARSHDWNVTCEKEDAAYQIRLPRSWETFLQQLSGKQRHELRRKMRRLQEAGDVHYRRVDTRSAGRQAIDRFLALFKASRPDKATFMTARMAAFFHALAKTFSDLNMLSLGFLELDGHVVSAVMGFDYRATRYLYNSGYDPRFGSLSVGLLCKVLSIKDAIDQGFACYDLLKGAEIYKQRLGAQASDLYRCTIRFP